ncbi:hypothetical protein RJ639_038421 [Escallonia herrerae]|uniref:UDP-glycosyltransferases domain-containing protein n=1 Tax=Escallonia herrerae TaxID=1293975 RepID=A0AA89B7H6_9ASTE|nr:hypothetical protein RJ639_038421 [Escallonia herrerae]
MDGAEAAVSSPHVLFFPLPLQDQSTACSSLPSSSASPAASASPSSTPTTSTAASSATPTFSTASHGSQRFVSKPSRTEAGVPLIYFDTIIPCALWTLGIWFAGNWFSGGDLDAKITSVPGLDSFRRRRDVPSFCHAYNLANHAIQRALREVQQIPRAHGLILNTFEKLDGPILALIPDLKISAKLLKFTEERGYIVGWAPQEEVLAHPAIGAFLTHSGWNSTLESIAEGVPMVCLPCFLEQQVISRFVSEVWKLGCDMKDTCDRVITEKVVRAVMEVRRDEFMQSADEMKKSARDSACKGGSSYCNLDLLIEDIRSMNVVKRARALEFKKDSILYS